MDDKNESEKLMKELKLIGEGFNKFIESIDEALNKLFYPKEDDWEMKCPYENNDDIYTLSNDGEVKKTTGHISIMTENVLSKVTSSQPKKQPNLKLNAEIYLHVLERSGMNAMVTWSLIGIIITVKNGVLLRMKKECTLCGHSNSIPFHILVTSKIKKMPNVQSNCLGMKSSSCMWKRGWRMKTINEIKDDDLVFNEQTHSQIYVSD